MIRCYNCGLEGHRTQVCPSYGPWYPEPGKDKGDYADKAQHIANLFAADIIREHGGDDDEPITDLEVSRGNLTTTELEQIVLKYPCTLCKVEPGQRCRSSKSHKNRYHQAVADGLLPAGIKW
jgi:hypothetical protein